MSAAALLLAFAAAGTPERAQPLGWSAWAMRPSATELAALAPRVDPDPRLAAAEALLARGLWREAASALEQLGSEDGATPQVALALADAHRRLARPGSTGCARAAQRGATSLEVWRCRALDALAFDLPVSGDLRGASAPRPASDRDRAIVALLAFAGGDFTAALDQAAAAGPALDGVWRGRLLLLEGDAAYALGDVGHAVAAWEQLGTLGWPQLAMVRTTRARVAALPPRRRQLAASVIEPLAAADAPWAADARLLLADAASALPDPWAAQAHLREVLASPGAARDAAVIDRLGRLCADGVDALSAAGRTVELAAFAHGCQHPALASVGLTLLAHDAEASGALGLPARAGARWAQLSRDPQASKALRERALLGLAHAYLADGRPEAALATLDYAEQRGAPPAPLLRGRALLATGALHEAEVQLTSAVDGPDGAAARDALAQLQAARQQAAEGALPARAAALSAQLDALCVAVRPSGGCAPGVAASAASE